jgi:hypothetical protein
VDPADVVRRLGTRTERVLRHGVLVAEAAEEVVAFVMPPITPVNATWSASGRRGARIRSPTSQLMTSGDDGLNGGLKLALETLTRAFPRKWNRFLGNMKHEAISEAHPRITSPTTRIRISPISTPI